jgi:succinate-semialdehyde dehydrogenase/glutarate-semialdehyde dehydrogenase
MERDTKVGPLARQDLVADLDRQISDSVSRGARILCGGRARTGRGYFYEPTVLAGVTPDMSAFTEETFGPAAVVIRAKDEEDAIALANESKYGLGGNVWTGDTERGKELARKIESGGVFINGMTASDPRLPFGGVKHSGYGRELSSWGIQEFTNIQTIWVGPAVGPQMTVPSE